MEEKINAFQRRHIRIILNRTWLKTISTEQLYTITEVEPLNNQSRAIKRRRLKWPGHLLHLTPQTPACRSLVEALKPAKHKPERPSLNWMQQVINDVRDINLIETQTSDSAQSIFSKLENAAIDRVAFRKKVDSYIPTKGVYGRISRIRSSFRWWWCL